MKSLLKEFSKDSRELSHEMFYANASLFLNLHYYLDSGNGCVRKIGRLFQQSKWTSLIWSPCSYMHGSVVWIAPHTDSDLSEIDSTKVLKSDLKLPEFEWRTVFAKWTEKWQYYHFINTHSLSRAVNVNPNQYTWFWH